MKVPTSCKMPDLSQLKRDTRNVLVTLLVAGKLFGEPAPLAVKSVNQATIPDKAGLYRLLFIRLIEKALDEYEGARLALAAELQVIQENTNRIYLGYGFTNHFENCVNAVCRLFKLEQRLVGGQVSDSSELVRLRDTIEHMDERIAKDEVEDGRPITLAITEEEQAVVIGRVEGKFKPGGPPRTTKDCIVTFEEMAQTLRRLYGVGEEVVEKKKWFPT